MQYNFPFSPDAKIIELGGGDNPRFRPNLDVRPGPQVDIVADFDDKLPIKSGEWDVVFSSYCIEHVCWRKVRQFLSEVHRILKDGGQFVFITANTEEQMRWVLNREWDDDSSCILFGGQDYEDNAHKNSLSPSYVSKLLQEAGFSDIIVIPWGQLGTDMIVEAKKPVMDRKSMFDRQYFNGGGKVGGYAREGYWDYPVHWVTFDRVMERKPTSVLEIGCARGYIVKRLQDVGVRAAGLEISRHCILTRVADNVTEWDICQTPWPFEDKQFDLCLSVAVMEHIPEEKLPAILTEIDRVSHRGLHGVDFGEQDDGFDQTHCTLRDRSWWLERMPSGQEVVNKEELESGSVALSLPNPDGKLKLNIGSYTTMFHHGWINMDILDMSQFASQHYYKFLQHDARERLPFDDDSVDLMFSSHFIEHLTYSDGIKFLKEAYRVMKPGSTFRLLCPDTRELASIYLEQALSTFDEIVDDSTFESHAGRLWTLLFNGHQAAYDEETLWKVARQAGFDKIHFKSFRDGQEQIMNETNEFFADFSIFVEIVK